MHGCACACSQAQTPAIAAERISETALISRMSGTRFCRTRAVHSSLLPVSRARFPEPCLHPQTQVPALCAYCQHPEGELDYCQCGSEARRTSNQSTGVQSLAILVLRGTFGSSTEVLGNCASQQQRHTCPVTSSTWPSAACGLRPGSRGVISANRCARGRDSVTVVLEIQLRPGHQRQALLSSITNSDSGFSATTWLRG